MLQPSLGPDLTLKPFDAEGRAQRRVELFEGDPTPMPKILRQEHRGARPPAHFLLDQIVAGQLGGETIMRVGQRSTMSHEGAAIYGPPSRGDQYATAIMAA